MGIGSFGFSEMLVIVVLVLIFFGPQRMPEIARGLGKAMREFRKSMNEVKRELEQAGMADDSPAWKQDTRDTQPRPSGTIEPPHMTAGAPPTGGPAATAETPAAESPAPPPPADAEPAISSTAVDDPGAATTAVDDGEPAVSHEAAGAPEDVPAASEPAPPEPDRPPAPSDPPA